VGQIDGLFTRENGPGAHSLHELKLGDRAMPTYKFKIGETVFMEAARSLNVPGGAYVVTQKMPERDGEFEYRVRSSDEPHERVVRESQLRGTS
jgi:hypothetical protein